MGPVPDPYFNPLADGEIACRTLPDTAEFLRWGPSPATTVWAGGIGRPERSGPAALQRLRSMQVAWRGGGWGFGREFALLRDGQARVPYPDLPGPRWASYDADLLLADATWGDLDGDGSWEAVVRLVKNTGGTGLFNFLGLVRERGGRLVNGPLVFIGDRTKLLGLRAGGGTVTVDMVVQGPNDGRCCPTDTVRVRFTIAGDELIESEDLLDDALGERRADAVPLGRARELAAGAALLGRRNPLTLR